MAAAKSKTEDKDATTPPAADPPKTEEPKTYKVTATRNLGRSITGGARIARGESGEVTLVPSRYDRLKKAEYFK